MAPKDKKLINFSEKYELNNQLRNLDKRQTGANREKLKLIGKNLKEKLGKTRLTHEELREEANKKINQLE